MNRIANTMSPADQAAHEKSSYVRPSLSPTGTAALARLEARLSGWFPVAADPRPGMSTAGVEALRRSDAATRRLRDKDYDAALNARGLAEYREYVGEVAA